jgi:hypothetical protein
MSSPFATGCSRSEAAVIGSQGAALTMSLKKVEKTETKVSKYVNKLFVAPVGTGRTDRTRN